MLSTCDQHRRSPVTFCIAKKVASSADHFCWTWSATAWDRRLCSDTNNVMSSTSAVKRDSTSDSSDDMAFECCVFLQERFESPGNENNTLNVRSSILLSTLSIERIRSSKLRWLTIDKVVSIFVNNDCAFWMMELDVASAMSRILPLVDFSTLMRSPRSCWKQSAAQLCLLEISLTVEDRSQFWCAAVNPFCCSNINRIRASFSNVMFL